MGDDDRGKQALSKLYGVNHRPADVDLVGRSNLRFRRHRLLMWFVYTAPDVGLTIFWGPAIPLLPLTFAVATVFGQPMTYTPPSTLVQLKMDGIVVKGFGISAPKSEDHELIESEHEPDNERRMLVAENGSIVGAVFVGPPGIGQHLNDAIQKNTDIILIKDALRAGNWEALAAE